MFRTCKIFLVSKYITIFEDLDTGFSPGQTLIWLTFVFGSCLGVIFKYLYNAFLLCCPISVNENR